MANAYPFFIWTAVRGDPARSYQAVKAALIDDSDIFVLIDYSYCHFCSLHRGVHIWLIGKSPIKSLIAFLHLSLFMQSPVET
jgi:hypothetical protein